VLLREESSSRWCLHAWPAPPSPPPSPSHAPISAAQLGGIPPLVRICDGTAGTRFFPEAADLPHLAFNARCGSSSSRGDKVANGEAPLAPELGFTGPVLEDNGEGEDEEERGVEEEDEEEEEEERGKDAAEERAADAKEGGAATGPPKAAGGSRTQPKAGKKKGSGSSNRKGTKAASRAALEPGEGEAVASAVGALSLLALDGPQHSLLLAAGAPLALARVIALEGPTAPPAAARWGARQALLMLAVPPAPTAASVTAAASLAGVGAGLAPSGTLEPQAAPPHSNTRAARSASPALAHRPSSSGGGGGGSCAAGGGAGGSARLGGSSGTTDGDSAAGVISSSCLAPLCWGDRGVPGYIWGKGIPASHFERVAPITFDHLPLPWPPGLAISAAAAPSARRASRAHGSTSAVAGLASSRCTGERASGGAQVLGVAVASIMVLDSTLHHQSVHWTATSLTPFLSFTCRLSAQVLIRG
jgi:hypothetical protein